MSVAIVSTPVRSPVHGAAADHPVASSAAQAAGAGGNFASLLLGQLAAGVELKNDVPQAAAEKAADATITTDGGTQDASLMLAALGLTAPEPIRQTATANISLLSGSAGKERTDSLVPLQMALVDSDLKGEAKKSESASLPTPLDANDKPAKFAMPDLAVPDNSQPKTELPDVNTSLSDATVAGLSTLAAHAPNNLDNAARNNEATLKVETSVRDHAWASDFGQKVVWLAANDKQSAQLTLNPPHMGPIEISLNLNKDNATAFFVSPNAEVRETIEAALPRLREMLAGVGIELGQANVGAESFRQQPENGAARQGSPRWPGDNAILGADAGRQLAGQTITVQRGNGMVDIFA